MAAAAIRKAVNIEVAASRGEARRAVNAVLPLPVRVRIRRIKEAAAASDAEGPGDDANGPAA
jgi:Arc/MetJ family transcription regulator